MRSDCRAHRSLHTPAPASSRSSTWAFSSSARSTASVPAALASRTATGPYGASALASEEVISTSGTPGPSRRRAKSTGRVAGAARPPLAWSWEASSRATAAANRPSRSISSANRSRRSSRSVVSRIAWTDAERGAPVRSASSPIAAPGPRMRSVRSPSFEPTTTRSRPRSTTKSSSASSPSRITQSPASARRGRASAASASSASSSAPASSRTPASVAVETPTALMRESAACARSYASIGNSARSAADLPISSSQWSEGAS